MADGEFRIRVDSDKCEGHNRCKALAPKLFELDEFGFATASGDGWIQSDQVANAENAIDNCPEMAIEIIEDRRA